MTENNEAPKLPRVLLVAPSLRILGGQAIQAKRLLKELSREESIRIDFHPIDPALPAALRLFRRVRFLRTIVSFLFYLPGIVVKVPRYDIIHIFSASYWSYTLWSLPPLILGKVWGKKVVLNYRSGEAEDHLAKWRSAVPTIKLADAVVAPSNYLVDVFHEFGIEALAIFNIIDPGLFKFRRRNAIRPALLTNRILEPLYNVGCILRAFQMIQAEYPDATLTIAHDGVCRPELEALACRLGLANVKFIGRVPHDQIAELYDQADIYLTSPNVDCMPGSILECFASGLPVLATAAGGIPYIVDHQRTGLLVSCNDHAALARGCLRLLREPRLVEDLTKAAYEELGKYSGSVVRRKWLELYRSILTKRSGEIRCSTNYQRS